jgi:Fe-S cluster assembly iron-binding protein IscA
VHINYDDNFSGGKLMFEITPKAEEMMVAFFKERNEKALVRIFLNEGG